MATLPYNDWIWQLYPKSQRPKPPKAIVFSTVKSRSAYKRRRQRETDGGNGWSREQWLELVQSYGSKCLKCGTNHRLVPDHVIPLKRGGKHELSNIQPLCFVCNRIKGLTIVDYR